MTTLLRHYSDVLCVWAYVGQVRFDELQRQFGSQIRLEWRYLDLFGDTDQKIGQGWQERGGWQAYADHVASVVGRFEHACVNPHTWSVVRPKSSAPAHQALVAVRLLEQRREVAEGVEQAFAWSIRQAFFERAMDVGTWSVLAQLLEEAGVSSQAVQRALHSGEAHAELCKDYALRSVQGIQGSPTLVLDGGRQKLYGNVGYRVIQASVSEHLDRRGEEFASWC